MYFELASDFVINETLKPHVGNNFRVAAPGLPLQCPESGNITYPKIITTGSGNAIHEPDFFTKIVAMTKKEKPNVVYIGTPFFDREDKYESGTKSFRNIGCRIKRLMVAKECTTPSSEEMRRIIVDFSDVIVVSGGNSLFAMLRWQSIGLDLLIKEAAVKGTVLCGGSAGCGCWFDTMQTDSLKPEACKLSERVLTELSAEERLNWSFVRISCMGYINAFAVPHIDTKGTNEVARVDIAKKMLLDAQLEKGMENPIIGFGVDELAGIVYEDGKLTIMSAGKRKNGIGEATCHILYVDHRREVQVIPITPNTGEAATLEELIERSMRSVEALQSPLDLIVPEEVSAAVHRRGVSGAIDVGGLIDAALPVLSEAAPPQIVEQALPPPPPTSSHHQRTPSNLLYSPAPLNLERITSHDDDFAATDAVPIGELPPPPAPMASHSPLFTIESSEEVGPPQQQRPFSAPPPTTTNPTSLSLGQKQQQMPPLFPRERDPPAIKVGMKQSYRL